MKRDTVPRQLLRLLQLLILGILYIVIKAAAKAPAIVDAVYSQKIYPPIRNVVSFATRNVPFSVAEAAAGIVIVVIAVLLVVRIITLLCLKKGAFVRLLSLIISVVLTASYLIVAFYVMWGFNYFRTPVAEKLDLPDREYSVEELEKLCYELAGHAVELREEVDEDENGVFTFDFGAVSKSIRTSYSDFGATRPSFKADVPVVKQLKFGDLFSRCSIAGIYVPFTEEPNVNSNEPALYKAFNAAHETAHYLGYAHEEDASFIAFLACMDSDDAALAYSTYMHALNHCANALAKADRKSYSALTAAYSDGMRKDFADYTEYYNKYSGTKTWEKSNELNDNYLKFNEQEKGVLSYEEDVALILRYFDSRRFFDAATSND